MRTTCSDYGLLLVILFFPPPPPPVAAVAEGWEIRAHGTVSMPGPRAVESVESVRRNLVNFIGDSHTKYKVKFTGLTQTLGQLQQPLIGILSQTAGSTGKFWVSPVNFRFELRGP